MSLTPPLDRTPVAAAPSATALGIRGGAELGAQSGCRKIEGMNTTTTTAVKQSGALHTGLDVLEVVSANSSGIGVTNIAAELGADKGNIHRVLRSLADRGYVEQDEHTKLFFPSGSLFRMAGTLLRQQNLAVVAIPFMRALSEELGAPVHLARRLSRGGVYIAREGSSKSGASVETEIGVQPPIHASATGKALFLLATPEELNDLLPGDLERFTDRTIGTLDGLWDEISSARRIGYTSDREELNIGVSCVAAPILDYSGAVVGSIGISGLAVALEDGALDHRGRRVSEVAALITERLGGKPLRGT